MLTRYRHPSRCTYPDRVMKFSICKPIIKKRRGASSLTRYVKTQTSALA
ncbi:Unknown protein sequence [Pseudomonas syringae pv. maculicola]|nr:Unknown protein sequence [Pseudomonas syringae pv. maculicola]